MGWFFGFKLHLIHDGRGELLSFMLPPSDEDDRRPLEYEAFIEAVDNGLKDISRVEHSRHRRFDDFIVRMLEAIAAYCGSPTRPEKTVMRLKKKRPSITDSQSHC